MSYILDTNILMDGIDIDILDKSRIYIPIIVLDELDKHNHGMNKERAFKAREATKFLEENKSKLDIEYVVKIPTEFDSQVEKFDGIDSPDNKILKYAEYIQSVDKEAILYTWDRNMYERALAFNIKCIMAILNKKNIYKGYIEVVGDTNKINQFFEDLDTTKLYINEYILIKDESTGEESELRWNGTELVPLIHPDAKIIKAKNALQRCVIDLMMNRSITTVAVLGGYGSGKTYLSTQMAYYYVFEKKKYDKILGIREPNGEGKDIGYLKGTFEDKTSRFFKPLEQQIKAPGGYDYLVLSQKLETEIPFYMKGTTYDNTVMVVDEAEDLSESQIRLIGTRIGENSRAFFSGDYAQSIKEKTILNPLVKMCEELKGNPMFGCIYLDEDVRSETSKMFANLFK